tara:strand:+ start:562 stop:1290 length:729 start_codon:yes stop_codon:yes gene_type:complete
MGFFDGIGDFLGDIGKKALPAVAGAAASAIPGVGPFVAPLAAGATNALLGGGSSGGGGGGQVAGRYMQTMQPSFQDYPRTSYKDFMTGDLDKDDYKDFKDDLSAGVRSGQFSPFEAYSMAVEARGRPSSFSSSFLDYTPSDQVGYGAVKEAAKMYGQNLSDKQQDKLFERALASGARDFGSIMDFAQSSIGLDPKYRNYGPLMREQELAQVYYGNMIQNPTDPGLKTNKYSYRTPTGFLASS